MSCSHGQELCQLADLASDRLFTLVQPIRSQLADLASDWLFTPVQPIRSQLADLASDWLFTDVVQPIRSQVKLLTHFLTMTTTHKLSSLRLVGDEDELFPRRVGGRFRPLQLQRGLPGVETYEV